MFIQNFMRVFFDLLYHPFAFAYDLVAALVSFGQWNEWARAALPFLEGKRVLELGCGPGYLQRALRTGGYDAVGLDESRPMILLAKRKLPARPKLLRGVAQRLPFSSGHFDSVIATFPSEYIFSPQTLSEVRRVLRPDGKIIALLAAFPKNIFLQWLYRVTGESPSALSAALQEKIRQPFEAAGFSVEMRWVDSSGARLALLIGETA
ncbi:MAG: class I SAM-dependent methyltransferase [Anaerolineales bacterium]